MEKKQLNKLLDHQIVCKNFILQNRGLILNHGLGTGKTLTSIVMFEALHDKKSKLRAMVAVPAKLIGNYKKELTNAKENFLPSLKNNNYTVLSYDSTIKADKNIIPDFSEMFTGVNEKDIQKKIEIEKKIEKLEEQVRKEHYKNVVLILDEAHVLRTASSNKYKSILKIANNCFRVIVLTATPMVNSHSDIATLMNLVSGGEYPTSKAVWDRRYVDTIYKKGFFYPFTEAIKEIKLKNTDDLQNWFTYTPKISCVFSDIENFPKAYFTSKKVEMSSAQYMVYKSLEDEILDANAKKILGKSQESESNALNTFLNKTRSVSNTLDHMNEKGTLSKTPKFEAIEEHIQKENRFPIVIYSFFLEAGVLPLRDILCVKYRCELIQGKTKDSEVSDIVDRYNSGRLDILFISSAAGYGLDLKNTKQVHITEPAWNKANVDQVIGRAIRFKSHHSLPVEERFVNVYHWLSVIPREMFSIPRPSADEYLFEISQKKNALIELFLDFICQVSIENLDNTYEDEVISVKRKGLYSLKSLGM